MFVGKPSISIPIWTVTSGDLSESVALSYNADNVRITSPYGAGWNIAAGGSITREVRTFPDDVGYQSTVKGWLYNNSVGVSIASDIGAFSPAADTLAGVREVGEGTDYAKINGFNYLVDTEPDVFSYSFGGMSGSFVIDNGLIVRTMPYEDIQITVNYTDASDRRITGFTIKTNTGHLYTFDYKVSVSKSTFASPYANADSYRTTEYELYKQQVTYTREWKLTRIDSPLGDHITFAYTAFPTIDNDRPVQIALYQYPDPFYANPSDIITPTIYHVNERVGRAYISSITSSDGPLTEFQYYGTLQQIKISDTRRGPTLSEQLVKTFNFSYLPVMLTYDKVHHEVEKTEQFLESLTEYSGCLRMPATKFTYRGIWNGPSYRPGNYLYATGLGIDLWGFPNGMRSNKHLFPKLYIYPDEAESERYRYTRIENPIGQEIILPGSSRHSGIAMLDGTLQSLTNPMGGVTTFFFEPNQYLDERTNTNATAGGLRIHSIEYFDGFNSIPIKKTFEYKDPTTGLSSGRLIRRPMLAMPALKWKSPGGSSYDKTWETPGMTTSEKWQYLTVRTSSDLTVGETTFGSPVGYTVVTVKRPGAGSARYEYDLPGTYGKFVKGSWKATTNRFARNASVSMGIVSAGGPWMFPHAVNPDFDYERGLDSRVQEFSESGKLVRETTKSYQYLYKSGSSPFNVSGLRHERYAGSDNLSKIFFYGKYFLLTEAKKVVKKETVKTFDANDATGQKFLSESTEYFYESPNHRLVTKIERTGGDGIVYGTQMKYPADYISVSSGSAEPLMITALKNEHRNGVPIEQVNTVTKEGAQARVVGGSIIRLDPMGMNRPHVRSKWSLSLEKSIRIDSFQHSSIINSNGYKLRMDPRYQKLDSIISYTVEGKVKNRFDPISRELVTTSYGFNSKVPVLTGKNVSDAQIAVSDFETMTGVEFQSSTAYYGAGRSGSKAFHPSVMLYRNIAKAPVEKYIISFWIKSNTAITLNVSLKNTAATATYYSTTISVPSTSSQFQFVHRQIPVTSVNASNFRIEIVAAGLSAPPAGSPAPGGLLTTLVPVLDDIFFFPEHAELQAFTYKFPFGIASVSTAHGEGSFTEFDRLGRERFLYDKNRDLVKRNAYFYGEETPLVADFSVPHPFSALPGIPFNFTAQTNECVTDATYEWDFGQGFQQGSPIESFTFESTGTYPVTLKVSSPTYGSKSITRSVAVVESPFNIEICAKGTIYFVGGFPDVIAHCSSITTSPTSTGVIFKVTHEGLGTSSYQWKRRDVGSSAWIDVGLNSAEYVVKSGSDGVTYEVKCVVTCSSGVGNSPTMQVTYIP